MRWTAVAMTVAAAALFGVRAQSQPTGCLADYTYDFEQRDAAGRVTWRVPDMECVQFFDVVVETPHGTRHIRGIGDVNADTFLPAGGIRAIESGVRQAAARFADLGDYKTADITILITGTAAEPATRVGDVWKHTLTAADALPGQMATTGRCPIRLFALGPMDNDDLKKAIAHEMFHCVQGGSLSVAQMKWSAWWWREGSAESFAVHVFPNRGGAFNREPSFRQSVERQTPIFRMDYEALFVFLFYQDEAGGISSLLPLLRSMPASNTDASQRGALRSMLSAEKWLDFAKAYDDRKIRYPNGRLADFGAPVPGEQWQINATSTHGVVLKPFVISPGYADYACGQWGNRLNPSQANLQVKENERDGWQKWPAETDCRDKGSERYRMMAMETGDSNRTVNLRADRRIACNNCLSGPTRIDACVVGVWEQTGGGPAEYLRRSGVRFFTRDNIGNLRMTMRDDGTFSSEAVGLDYQLTVPVSRRGPAISDTRGSVRGTTGRWSAAEGTIKSCFDSGGQSRGSTVTRYPNGLSYTHPMDGAGVAGISGSASYRCTATTLHTTNPTRFGPMEYTFRRVSPPPRR